ncbi:probable RNA helicase armi isoform X2 [Sipha flava]|uniref:RNA helicase n=1 Tax=Sipha flava TaxID=143950 RepID=A0A8B8GPN9_9HEMI|nr:probable RNA helicase armi isoform X2 [Sipha flava]
MVSLLTNIWNWVSGQTQMHELPENIFFEKDVSADNGFWISCILDPTLEIKYVNGIVTHMLDTDKCLINGIYHYQPKTEKEIRNFPYIEVNSAVRISLYRKKNSNAQWQVASCFISKEGSRHRGTNVAQNESVRVHFSSNESPPHINQVKENDESLMTVEVMGDMPKMVALDHESTIQILFRNNSFVEEQELIDYHTMEGNKSQLFVANKIILPLIIGAHSQYIFDINIKGKYLGKSTEKVIFIFKDITYKVGINIDITDSRIIIPNNPGIYTRKEVDMKRLFELLNDPIILGVHKNNRVQFPAVKIGNWNIPSQLTKCFWTEDGKFNTNLSEIKTKIATLYPAVFETLTYHNYKAKFHSLLFIEEIEVFRCLQKYSKERIHFDHVGEYLVLKIPDLSEQRPSLIPGDRISVTDPPNCTKRLGESGQYEGIIHRVLADEIWLKFDPEFHSICGHWDYSVNFFNSRTVTRKQHEVIDKLWEKKRLGESFLFPYRDCMEYQPSKLEITSLNEINTNPNFNDNLDMKTDSLLPSPKVVQNIRWFNEKLNSEQKSAVINILKGEGRPMPYIIYGPPGTGKTITLTEAIIQVYKQFPKSKLLICAPTNAAVDILLSKLVNSGLFNPSILKRLVGYNHFISNAYDMDFDEYCALPELESSVQYQETDSKLIRKRDILKLRIVLTTEGSSGILYMMGLKSGTFTHIFIDEAGQSMEPEILLPLSFLDPSRDGQVVLAGDPKQLGPVLMSNISKFSEHNGYNPKVITHLVKNYRSVPEILHNYSKLFYKSLLVATKVEDNTPERILLNNLNENVHWEIGCKGPVIVHGIIGENHQEPHSPSWFNPHEAFQVLLYVTRLMKAGISADDIGIITPYSSQIAKISELLKMYHPSVKLPKVGSVEMFQGQEKMVILISMVRNQSLIGNNVDEKFKLGFLMAKERTNVAISRAKALLIIIGNPFIMQKNTKWNYILQRAIREENYIGCTIPEVNADS